MEFTVRLSYEIYSSTDTHLLLLAVENTFICLVLCCDLCTFNFTFIFIKLVLL